MSKLRILLVDDERIGRTRLRRLLERDPALEIAAECADGASALHAVRQYRPHLVFLDIDMPGMDGFEVLDQLTPEEQPQVIFVTAFDEHAVRAFEAAALDYLLKPVSPERLQKALDRAKSRLSSPGAALAAEPASATGSRGAAGAPAHARFVVRSGGRVSFVAPEEIDWIEAAGNYAIFHTGAKNHMVRETMSGLEARLPMDYFLRVSRSAIVNLRRVKELYTSPMGAHAAILSNAQSVPVTRAMREVAERLSNL